MATLAQIRSRVARKIINPDLTGAISASVVNEEINRAIRYYSKYRFFFNEELADITLTADNQVLPSVPSDLLSPFNVNGIMVIDSQVKVDLIRLNPVDFFNRDQDQTGRPYFYTYRNGQFLLLPTPDQAYPVKFRYLKKYADLSSDSDTNDFTDNAEDLITLDAVRNLYGEDKQDPATGMSYSEIVKREFDRLVDQTNDYNASGYVSNESILEPTYYY